MLTNTAKSESHINPIQKKTILPQSVFKFGEKFENQLLLI